MNCPECRNFDGVCDVKMVRTDWSPKRGLDLKLREFKCPLCGKLIYCRPCGREGLVKERVKRCAEIQS